MSENSSIVSSPTVSAKTPKLKTVNKSGTPRKKQNSPTEEQVQTRGPVKQSELVKWTIFARPEVKIAVQKAAKKAGITDTAWLDAALWEVATAELSKRAQPPAKPEDMVKAIIDQYTEQLKTEQAAAIEAQNALIQGQGAKLDALTHALEMQAKADASRPTSIKELFFGKKKPASDGI